MRTLEERVKRLEMLVSKLAFNGAEQLKKMLPEKEVTERYNIGKARLKQLRLGYKDRPAVLKNWTHVNGRNRQYDVAELDRVLRRKKYNVE